MKKKLVMGLGIISAIFVASGALILLNLNQINSGERMMDHLDQILDRYGTMVEQIKNAQIELYRRQAGYPGDAENLVQNVSEFQNNLNLTGREYTTYLSRAECNNCHSGRTKMDTVRRRLEEAQQHLNAYRKTIGLIVDSKEGKFLEYLEGKATREGEAVLLIMGDIRHATIEAKAQMEGLLTAAIRRSRYSITLALFLGIFLSAFTALGLIKSVTRPVNMLVKGIERVSYGDYRSKVDIKASDEIGFLAKTFNEMTENLAKTTQQKEVLFSELQNLNGHLEQRVREATKELKIAHEKMVRSETLSAVGTFASGVAHELATPLSSVLSYFQLIKPKLLDDERLSNDVGVIEGELMRSRTILQGMLKFAKASQPDKVRTNVATTLSELVSLVRYQTEYKKVSIKEDFDQLAPDVLACPAELKQVFLNIMLNALQAMPEGGDLLISTRVTGSGSGTKIEINIADTGVGIPESEMGKIFEPFYTTKKSGTGLGLSVSYGIVKAHGGNIVVQKNEGKGTTFSIYLPSYYEPIAESQMLSGQDTTQSTQ